MNIKLANRMNELNASEIREILKVTQCPDMISFAGGLPAAELFPVEEMAAAAKDVLAREQHRALQYSTTEGCPELRDLIARRMNDRQGTHVSADEILITSGSQQGLDLLGKLFLDDGDVVLCESPTYLGALSAFRVFRPRLVEVASDDEGLIPAALERSLDAEPAAKFIYVIPDFQNPTGRRWSLARRQEIMTLAQRYNIPLVEDSPYAELHFEPAGQPALKSLDRDNLVIFAGTFSKTLCPGLRIAWLAARPELLRNLVLIKQGTDLHTSTFSQLQILSYLNQPGHDQHIRHIRTAYRERCRIMLDAMDHYFPAGVRYTRPRGGMFLWVELPAGHSARDLLPLSLDQKVAFVPGGSFFPNGGHENTLRLNFTAMPASRIVTGIERLGAVLERFLGKPARSESPLRPSPSVKPSPPVPAIPARS